MLCEEIQARMAGMQSCGLKLFVLLTLLADEEVEDNEDEIEDLGK